MPLITLSNPLGLDLAVLGNPGRRQVKRTKSRRSVRIRRWVMNPATLRKLAGSRKTRDASFRLGLGGYPADTFDPDALEGAPVRRRKAKKARKMKTKTTRSNRKSSRKAKGKQTRKSRKARRSKTMAVKTRKARKSRKSRARKVRVVRVRRTRRASRARKMAARRWVGRTWHIKTKSGKRRSIRIVRARARKVAGKKRGYAKRWTKSGRKGTVGLRARVWSRKRGSRRVYFTNPGGIAGMVKGYVGGLTSAPGTTFRALKGKGMVKSAAVIGGGTLATFVLGGVATRQISPLLAKIPGVSALLASDIGKRVVSGLMPYTLGFIAARFIKNPMAKSALLTGGAMASIVSVLAPKALDTVIDRVGLRRFIPALGSYEALAGYFGDATMLAGYVNAPSYQGVAGYVNAPSYAGTGEDMLAGYVDAPAYQGTQGIGAYLDQNYLEKSYLDV
jgi:hypothetical protein